MSRTSELIDAVFANEPTKVDEINVALENLLNSAEPGEFEMVVRFSLVDGEPTQRETEVDVYTHIQPPQNTTALDQISTINWDGTTITNTESEV